MKLASSLFLASAICLYLQEQLNFPLFHFLHFAFFFFAGLRLFFLGFEKKEVKSLTATEKHTIIGAPQIIDAIEIAENNFPNYMNWMQACKACESLGDGWRLPTKEEMLAIQNKGCLEYSKDRYWTCTFGDLPETMKSLLHIPNLPNDVMWRDTFTNERYLYVRAVRSIHSK